MKINVNHAQKIQNFFVVDDNNFENEKKYQRFKKIEKKNQTNLKTESISKT